MTVEPQHGSCSVRGTLSQLRLRELHVEVKDRVEKIIDARDHMDGLVEAMLAVTSGLDLDQTAHHRAHRDQSGRCPVRCALGVGDLDGPAPGGEIVVRGERLPAGLLRQVQVAGVSLGARVLYRLLGGGRYGDLRDWTAISAFTDSIAQALKLHAPHTIPIHP